MTVGVPDKQNEVKPRLPVESIVHADSYDTIKYDEQLIKYDKIMNEYYSQRATNQKDVTWSSMMTDFLSNKRRKHMKEFINSKGYLKD